jgi:hypothetical protein
MLVINHMAKILRFGSMPHADVLAGKAPPAPLKKGKPGEYKPSAILMLVPGANEVSPEVWAHVCARFPSLKGHYMAEDLVEVVEDAKGETVTADDIGKLNEKAAVKLVKATADEAMLLRWLDTEERKGVVEAIENQLEALAKAGEPVKKEA